ncbi:MAG: hypothetical protein CMO19_01015 [Thaumarchaeota archaeon]|nr:hypothetical protein [Nitrososphaerota archaeon]|tara:strand:- start:11376 stop:11687 length:312 start_codon:yes stop_codon:yes gene_type:complete
MNKNNKLENLTLTVIKTILILVIALTIISVILEISFSQDIWLDSLRIAGMNLLDFVIIFLLFMIPVSRLSIMIREFSRSKNHINAVSEVVVLGIILVLVARII